MAGGVAWSSQRPLGEAQLPNRTRPPRSLSYSLHHHHSNDHHDYDLQCIFCTHSFVIIIIIIMPCLKNREIWGFLADPPSHSSTRSYSQKAWVLQGMDQRVRNSSSEQELHQNRRTDQPEGPSLQMEILFVRNCFNISNLTLQFIPESCQTSHIIHFWKEEGISRDDDNDEDKHKDKDKESRTLPRQCSYIRGAFKKKEGKTCSFGPTDI